jgi:hypothetical protein
VISLKPHIWPEGLPAIPVSWGGRGIPSLRDSTWKDIDLLLSRSWFRRSWIVQELILASNIMVNCGRWSLNWDDLFEGLKICRDKLQSEVQINSVQGQVLTHGDPAYALGLTRESRIKFNDAIFGRKYHLLEFLDLFAYTQASEERDKIFALLGLATDCSGEVFDPGYGSPLEDVVCRYANEFVREDEHLIYYTGLELPRHTPSVRGSRSGLVGISPRRSLPGGVRERKFLCRRKACNSGSSTADQEVCTISAWLFFRHHFTNERYKN